MTQTFCRDCQNFSHCSWLLGLEGAEPMCDFTPSRFKPKEAEFRGGIRIVEVGQILGLNRKRAAVFSSENPGLVLKPLVHEDLDGLEECPFCGVSLEFCDGDCLDGTSRKGYIVCLSLKDESNAKLQPNCSSRTPNSGSHAELFAQRDGTMQFFPGN